MDIYKTYDDIETIIKTQTYLLLKYISEKEKLNFKDLCKKYLHKKYTSEKEFKNILELHIPLT